MFNLNYDWYNMVKDLGNDQFAKDSANQKCDTEGNAARKSNRAMSGVTSLCTDRP